MPLTDTQHPTTHPADNRDHTTATSYVHSLPATRRKAQGIHFTPPNLVRHLLTRLEVHGFDFIHHAVQDPSAGGAAFLLPLVHRITTRLLASGASHADVREVLLRRVHGTDIAPDLTRLANTLIRQALLRDHGIETPKSFALVKCADALRTRLPATDIVLGNPPYVKVSAADHSGLARRFSDILGGQLNLYALFLRRALDIVQPGGLVGFIVPTSFLQGPAFRTLRIALTARADLLALDLIDRRRGAFTGVTQDTCFVVLRRHEAEEVRHDVETQCAILHADGTCMPTGTFIAARDGTPWRLPSLEVLPVGGHVLADLGYRVGVGHFVPHKHAERLTNAEHPFAVPLVTDSCVRSDGSFDLGRAESRYVAVPMDASYVARGPCVVVRRTANRKQARQLSAAAVPPEVVARGGVVGENHVLLLTSDGNPRVSPEGLARLLNSGPVNRRWGLTCGTGSVSAQVLRGLDLPGGETLVGLDVLPSDEVDEAVRMAYAASKP